MSLFSSIDKERVIAVSAAVVGLSALIAFQHFTTPHHPPHSPSSRGVSRSRSRGPSHSRTASTVKPNSQGKLVHHHAHHKVDGAPVAAPLTVDVLARHRETEGKMKPPITQPHTSSGLDAAAMMRTPQKRKQERFAEVSNAATLGSKHETVPEHVAHGHNEKNNNHTLGDISSPIPSNPHEHMHKNRHSASQTRPRWFSAEQCTQTTQTEATEHSLLDRSPVHWSCEDLSPIVHAPPELMESLNSPCSNAAADVAVPRYLLLQSKRQITSFVAEIEFEPDNERTWMALYHYLKRLPANTMQSILDLGDTSFTFTHLRPSEEDARDGKKPDFARLQEEVCGLLEGKPSVMHAAHFEWRGKEVVAVSGKDMPPSNLGLHVAGNGTRFSHMAIDDLSDDGGNSPVEVVSSLVKQHSYLLTEATSTQTEAVTQQQSSNATAVSDEVLQLLLKLVAVEQSSEFGELHRDTPHTAFASTFKAIAATAQQLLDHSTLPTHLQSQQTNTSGSIAAPHHDEAAAMDNSAISHSVAGQSLESSSLTPPLPPTQKKPVASPTGKQQPRQRAVPTKPRVPVAAYKRANTSPDNSFSRSMSGAENAASVETPKGKVKASSFKTYV